MPILSKTIKNKLWAYLSILMSTITQQKARAIPKDPKENWTDLGIDGRKLKLIINQCFTKAYGKMRIEKGETRKEIEPVLFFSYVDTMVKCMLAKQKLAAMHLGVKEALAEVNKR